MEASRPVASHRLADSGAVGAVDHGSRRRRKGVPTCASSSTHVPVAAGSRRSSLSVCLPVALLGAACALKQAFAFDLSLGAATACADLVISFNSSQGTAPYTLLVGLLYAGWSTVVLPMDYMDEEIWTYNHTLPNLWRIGVPDPSSVIISIMDATQKHGNTSVITPISASPSNLCAGPSENQDFFFGNGPAVECQDFTVSWGGGPSNEGGGTFAKAPYRITVLPENMLPMTFTAGPVSNFTWMLELREGTRFVLAMGDDGPTGSGGTTNALTVGAGNMTSCLNGPAQAPFSLLPATSTAPVKASSKSRQTTWPVVGGVLGALVLLACLGALLLFFKRRKSRRRTRQAVLWENDSDARLGGGDVEPYRMQDFSPPGVGHASDYSESVISGHPGSYHHGSYPSSGGVSYGPVLQEPRSAADGYFLSPHPTPSHDDPNHSSSPHTVAHAHDPSSSTLYPSSAYGAQPLLPMLSTSSHAASLNSRTSGQTRVFRHTDAGPVPMQPGGVEENEDGVIELPPDYQPPRRDAGASGGSDTGGFIAEGREGEREGRADGGNVGSSPSAEESGGQQRQEQAEQRSPYPEWVIEKARLGPR